VYCRGRETILVRHMKGTDKGFGKPGKGFFERNPKRFEMRKELGTERLDMLAKELRGRVEGKCGASQGELKLVGLGVQAEDGAFTFCGVY